MAPPLLWLGRARAEAIARWSGRGLTAYDASYVAVAEETGVPVIADDAEICRVS